MSLTIISKVNGVGESEAQKRERLARKVHVVRVPVSSVGPDYTPVSLVSPRNETLEKTRVPG